MFPCSRRRASLLAAAVLLASASFALAEQVVPTAEEIEDALPEGAALTGQELYERFLKNRLHSAVQHQRVVSTDPGGSEQRTRFWVQYKDFTSADARAAGISSKTLVKFESPPDMRNTGYLMIAHTDHSADHFVYLPSDRRVRRVRLEGMTVLGTDYTFDDITYKDMSHANYVRLPDEVLDGFPCYAIEMTLPKSRKATHHRTIAYLEKKHYVLIRQRFYDRDGVEIREMRANPASIREFDGIWVATEGTMKSIQEDTISRLYVENLDPNPALGDQLFSLFRLGLSR